ncbi:MAG: ABC transporter permease [Acutalibacteraceae bacterium]|jgi:teichoic acid transport system permease protein
MKRFINDLQKYFRYSTYSARSQLKAEVAGSHLNWLWWILDPICFMLVYTLVFSVVLPNNIKNFPIFVFIGLTNWNLFNRTITNSVRIVKMNKSVVSKVYLPKYILVLTRLFVNLFKTLIQFAIIVVMLLLYRVPFSIHSWNLLPSFLILSLITFGLSTIMMHFGVFVEDLENIIRVVLQLAFYMSGIFYDLYGRLKANPSFAPFASYVMRGNPIAFFNYINRRVLLEGKAPFAVDYITLGLWGLMGLALAALGIRLVYKYENGYAKMI